MRKHLVLLAPFLVAGFASSCAHFWTIPGEPLTTEEVCERAQPAHVRSAPGGVGYRSLVDKNRLSANALYELAAAGDPRFAFPLYVQANSLLRQARTYRSDFSMSERRSMGPDYWTVRCRQARERDLRGR